MSESVIRLDKVGCKAGYHNLLKDITWDVKRGEHWVVFGMNGSGKTTLLSIIAGFRQATSGTMQVLGEHFSNENILEIRKRIGWVSSSFLINITARSLLCILYFPVSLAHWDYRKGLH